MNNIPEKENNEFYEEEFSTIFSDPAEHKKIKNNAKKQKIQRMIAVLLVFAIIVGATVYVITQIAVKKPLVVLDETVQILLTHFSADASKTEDILADDKTAIMQGSILKNVEIVNKNGTFNFYSQKEEVTNEITGEPQEKLVWYLTDYDKKMISNDAIAQKVKAVSQLEASRKISSKTAEDCGLKNPKIKFQITTEKEKFTIFVGDESPDNSGVYVKFEDKDEIYLASPLISEELNFTKLDLASTKPQAALALGKGFEDYYSDGTLLKFDKLTISGEAYDKDIVMVQNTDKKFASFVPYTIVEPMKRDAANTDAVFAMLAYGFEVDGAYSYDVKKQTLKKLGLDSPDYIYTAEFGDYSYTYKFKRQSDGGYAYICNDSKNVRRTTLEKCPFLGYGTSDYYSKTLFIVAVNDVKNMTFKTQDDVYKFDISKSVSSDEKTKYLVEYDGSLIDSSNFQNFYQFLCLIQLMDFKVNDIDDEPELTITYNYNDKKKAATVVEFFKTDTTKYQCSVNGVMMGKIGSTSYKKIITNLQNVIEGKQVVVD